VDVKAGKSKEFHEALAKHVEWRKENGDPWSWATWEVVNGEGVGDFVFVSTNHDWADLDVYGDFGSEAFAEQVGPYVTETTAWIDMFDESISKWPEEQGKIMLVSVIEFQLKPGKHMQFVETVNKYHKTILEDERPVHYGWSWTLNGGPGGMVTLLLPFESWADMAGPEESMEEMMIRVHGKEKAMKLDQQFADTFSSSKSSILVLHPEYSLFHEE
jgi:hypothetical protein